MYFRPSSIGAVAPAPQPYAMSTQRKQFVPRILPITVGSRVRFPNQDPILHNAFSTSKDNPFDVGLYGQGDEQTVTFQHAGYVRVYCNVHHSMVGHILVLDTPYFTRPDARGHFRLQGLPEAEGEVVVWHDRATPWHRSLRPSTAGSLAVQLDPDPAPHSPYQQVRQTLWTQRRWRLLTRRGASAVSPCRWRCASSWERPC